MLETLGKALNDERAFVRRAAAYGVGVAAQFGGPPYEPFVAAAAQPIVAGVSKPRTKDSEETLARDNHIAARA